MPTIKAIPEVDSIEIASPKPGDVVVVTVKRPLPMSTLKIMTDRLKNAFPNNEVIIVESSKASLTRTSPEPEILGYYADGRPIYPAERGSLVTHACILCRDCRTVISTSGGPGIGSICIKCHKD